MAVGTLIGQPSGGFTPTVIGIGGKPSDTLVANMALGHIGVSKQIGNMVTEKSTEAVQCALYYPQAIQESIEGWDWPELTTWASLALVATQPNDDWAYAYNYLNDCAKIRRIVTINGRKETNPPAWKLGTYNGKTSLFAQVNPCPIEYTRLLTDITQASALLVGAISWRLASFIAPALTRMQGRAESCFQMYQLLLSQAEVQRANEQQHEPELESEMIRARG